MKAKDLIDTEKSQEEINALSRRQLLKWSAAAGAGIMVASGLTPEKAAAQSICPANGTIPPPPNVTKFVDFLPLPQVAMPFKQDATSDFYQVSIDDFPWRFHSQMRHLTPVWGYGNQIPGPTFVATRGRKIVVTFKNNLPPGGYLPGMCPDPMVMGAAVGEMCQNPTPLADPLTVVHLHGSDSPPQFDGFPYDRIPPGASYTHEFPNTQPPTTLWYHDHSMGLTRMNVYGGLAGFYLLTDPNGPEGQLALPGGPFEIPLLIQDKAFNPDGTLWQQAPWQPELFANTIAVNGKLWPKLQVTRGKYRFRILNGSNARFYNLYLDLPSPATAPADFIQIGTDGGYLAAPVPVTPSSYVFNDVYAGGAPSSIVRKLLIAPAERADVIVDFSGYPVGTKITLKTDAPAPFPGGDLDLTEIMQFEVVNGPRYTNPLPNQLISPPFPNSGDVVKVRNMALVDWGFLISAGPTGGSIGTPPPLYPYPTLLLNNLRFNDPLTECPLAESTEIWNLINFAPDTHPIHLHQVQFKILGRAKFNALAYANDFLVRRHGAFPPPDPRPFLQGPFNPPDPNELGPKDVVRANPGEVTQLLVKWSANRGKFLWHCHILDHEDNEMMRPVLVC